MARLNLRQCLRVDLSYGFTKLYITPPELYPTVREEVGRCAGSRNVVELETDLLAPIEAVAMFREAGRSGDILIVKADQDVGIIGYMTRVWYVSGGRYGDGRGELVRDDYTTDGSDWTKEGFTIILWATPEAYQKMDFLMKREVYPPKNCYHFLTVNERDWEIFKN